MIMNKKFIEFPNKFDKKEYDKNYRKEHYVRFSASVKPELKERIDEYCKNENISKTEFLKRAITMFEKQ